MLKLLFMLLMVGLNAQALPADAERYRVVLKYLPDHIDPRRNQINTNHYILLHLYYPLFTVKDNGELESEYLDMKRSKALSPAFTRFQFCLRDKIQFSDGSRIKASDLRESLKSVHATQESLPQLISLETKLDCVVTNLAQADTSYFDRLIGTATAILKFNSLNTPFPIGLGPYRVRQYDADRIELEPVGARVQGNIRHVEFLRAGSLLAGLHVDDDNHMYQGQAARESASDQKTIETPLIKSYALVVNLPTLKMRKEIGACLKGREIRLAIRPGLIETPGFLPNGVYGSNVNYNKIKTTFGACRGKLPKNIPFIVLLPNEKAPVQDVLKKQPGLRDVFLVQSLPPNALAHAIFDRKPKVLLLGFDSSGSLGTQSRESSVFFETFVRPERLISQVPAGLNEILSQANQASNEKDKNMRYEQAHQILLTEGLVIPLGQANNVQHYAKNIENIEWADRLSGFPRINKMVRTKR